MEERTDLADQCIAAEFRKGEVISQMGDYSDQMCLVARGAVRLSVEGTEVAAVEPGGSFGDDSLMHDLRRSSTATASTDIVKLVCVPRRALREVLRGERYTELWDAYRSYEESLLKRLVQDVESAKTRQDGPSSTWAAPRDGVADTLGADLEDAAAGRQRREAQAVHRGPAKGVVAHRR